MSQNNQPFFSLVMAVYNVEKYLDEALESLLKQTFSFDNIEIILVNDGSTDSSAKICENYAKRYQNIIYISKENGGVSSARNAGIDVATGKYINFMDPDDRLDKHCLEIVHKFFINNPKIKIATIPYYMFEAKNGSHILNFKFKDERVVDSQEEFNSFFMSSSTSFINRDILGTRRFTLGRKYGEDNELMTELVVENRYFGLIPEAKYYYRKRYENTSALNYSNEDPDYFIPFFLYLKGILEKHTVNGVTNKYVQAVIFYDMAWKLEKKDMPLFLEDKIDEFKDIIYDMLSYIDRDVILESRVLNYYQKHAVLSWKSTGLIPTPEYGFYKEQKDKNNLFLEKDNGEKGFALSRTELKIDILDFQDETLTIIGYYDGLYSTSDLLLNIQTNNGEIMEYSDFKYSDKQTYLLGCVIHNVKGFLIEIPYSFLLNHSFIEFKVNKNSIEKSTKLNFHNAFAKLINSNKFSYLVMNNKKLSYNESKRRLIVSNYNKSILNKQELKFLNEMLKTRDKKLYLNIPWIFYIRKKARNLQLTKNKKINIFMDRVDKADDNAEVLYDYSEKNNDGNFINYFVIDKKSEDYSRLKNLGYNVIAHNSNKHVINLLAADNVISSHADEMMYGVYKYDKLFKDIKQFKYIFLQHGVIKEDLSHWLKRSKQNFSLFLTSSPKETESIISGDYQYTSNEVKTLGLPRFDRLKLEEKEKFILVMPTWRHDIVLRYNHKIKGIPYTEKFKKSAYFKFWNNLLNNNDLIDYCEKKSYKIVFAPHPSIRQQIEDFNLEHVVLADYSDRYVDLFNKSAIMITDYSSTFFDFSYLKKPVIYYHFDSGNWDRTNAYFSYADDGFGPIIQTEIEVVNYIKELITNDAKMEDEYQVRVDKFFKYRDQNNSKRVYEEIVGGTKDEL